MTATLPPSIKFQPLVAGVPLPGGKVYFYAAGTTTPQAVYAGDGTTPLANPVILDANGATSFRLGAGLSYKIDVYDANDVHQTGWPEDNVQDLATLAVLTSDLASTASGKGDALVGVKQPFAGALARTIHDKISEFVSVTDFLGADPTGVTDSTSAFSAALATGKNVFVPPGTYQVGLLTMTTLGQTLYGLGASSVLVQKTAGANGIYVQAAYVTIRDLRMNGVETVAATTWAVYTNSAYPAPYLTCSNLLISGTDASHGWGNGVKFDDSIHYGTVRDCKIERTWGTASGQGYGVLSGDNTGTHISGLHFVGTSGRGRHGVYLSSGTSYATVMGNHIEGCSHDGISVFSTSAQTPCSYNVIIGNTIKGCCTSGNATSAGILIMGKCSDNVVQGNTVIGSLARGISLDGTNVGGSVLLTNTVVNGNTILNSTGRGLNIGSTNRTVGANNIIRESGYGTTGTYSNIHIDTDGTNACADTLLIGNHCSGTTYARSSLTVNPGPPAPTGLVLSGNRFTICQAYNLELNGVTGISIDGRIQFRQDSVAYGPIANGAAVTTGYTVTGAQQGDVVSVTHSSDSDGCAIYAYVSATNTVKVVVMNNSGGSKTIVSGTLRIDVWQRSSPLSAAGHRRGWRRRCSGPVDEWGKNNHSTSVRMHYQQASAPFPPAT